MVQILHRGAIGPLGDDREFIAIEAEDRSVFGQQPLNALGEHAQNNIAECMVVQRIDAREIVETEQQHTAGNTVASKHAVEHLDALIVHEQSRRRIDLALALEVGNHTREHGRSAVLVALHKPAADDPHVFALAVSHLILEVVRIGTAGHHVIDGFVEALKIALGDECAP